MRTFSVTDIGLKRTINQDYVYCNENKIGNLPCLFVVADGMGGHRAGDKASRVCVDVMCETVSNSEFKTPVSILKEAVLASHKRIIELSESDVEYEGMGTTLVAATIVDDTLYVVNVGDSRLYLLRDSLSQITEDHSLVEEMVKSGELAKEYARIHPNKNIITRALGIGSTINPDFFELKIGSGDIILMCSDGLTNMVEDAEIEYIIKRERADLNQAGMTLLNRANDAGGKDNITVLLAEV
ncbi:MAG: Stp1/IreP family PP2C-type Ser/Thr phosphatase [Lachnospiraceae bacterium]|nr:Stp1/IreP family PP2C-type Ser/Thr phosphatase [Lachnospiraceae bacterium]